MKYLHKKSMGHGGICPASVTVKGGMIKLRDF
jgi:hypothetical protein